MTELWTRPHGVRKALSFKLSGRQRQNARPGPVKMYGVPPARGLVACRWRAALAKSQASPQSYFFGVLGVAGDGSTALVVAAPGVCGVEAWVSGLPAVPLFPMMTVISGG